MSSFSEDEDSLGDALSDYNDAFYDDAKDYIENEINKQLECEMNDYINTNINELTNNNVELKNKYESIANILNDCSTNTINHNNNNNNNNRNNKTFKFNVNCLKESAKQKYGFINNKLRKLAWPLVIINSNSSSYNNDDDDGFDDDYYDKFNNYTISRRKIESHRYYNQIRLDVVRTLKRFPSQISGDLRSKLQNELIDIICKILIKQEKENLNYYQGYHDVCLTFLLVNGIDDSIPLLECITKSHLKPFMEPTMETTMQLLQNILPLINELNSEVAEHIQKAGLGVMFALSWFITWYSHVLDDLNIILRLYDLFIVSHPLMPVYLGAVIVCERSDEILLIDCDMASLHTVILKYPSQIKDINEVEVLIEKAIDLFSKYPVDSLSLLSEKWKEKCELIDEQVREEQLRQEQLFANNLRHRGMRSPVDNEYGGNRGRLGQEIVRRKFIDKKNVNKLLVSVIAVGIASAAAYAFGANNDEPKQMFMRLYQLFSYNRDF